MANIFTIKHGAEVPPDNTLQPYELGYADNGGLVIGDAEGKTKTISPERVAEATNAIKLTKDGKSVIQLGVNLASSEWRNLDGSEANDQNQLHIGAIGVLPLNFGGLGVDASTDEGKTTARSNLGISLANLGVTASTAELNYCAGVTSAIQTQLNGKQASITGAATTIASSDLTASRVLVSNSSGKVAVSNVTTTELNKLDGLTATTAELNYCNGVTSNIQTQFNNLTCCETQTKTISGNSSETYTFSKNVKAVQVVAYTSGANYCVSAFWDLNTSGRIQSMYGWLTKASLDTWSTTATISGKTVTVSRNSSTALIYSVTAFF